MNLTTKEKQVFVSLLPALEEKLQNDISTIKSFKWLCNIAQTGKEYEDNRNIWEWQKKGIKDLEQDYEFRKKTILKVINQ